MRDLKLRLGEIIDHAKHNALMTKLDSWQDNTDYEVDQLLLLMTSDGRAVSPPQPPIKDFLKWLYDNDVYVYFNDDRDEDGHVFLSDFKDIAKDWAAHSKQSTSGGMDNE